jgi:UDP-N-acetylglucosamine:LPS N-acetylglucosamine transferase
MLNANYLARHQAAIVVDDADLSQVLRDMVMNLITNQEQLKAMGKASKSLAQPKAAARLAQEILGMGAHGN